jgi:hypothetical protein
MNIPVPVRSLCSFTGLAFTNVCYCTCSPALLYECTVYFLDDCSSVSDLDVDSNGPADPGWESGFRQAKLSPKKGKKEDNSCLKSSLLGWRLLLESECPL